MGYRILLLLWMVACASIAQAQLLLPAPSSDLVAGIDAYNRKDFPLAKERLQAAVNRSEAEAMVNLGYMYARGHGVVADPDFALKLYNQAAKMGDGEGMNAVGYRYNFAPVPDFEKAVNWYCRAIFIGNPRAMNNMAILFYNGSGVQQDRQEARDLWRQAINRGSLNAMINLGTDLWADSSSTQAQRTEGYELSRNAALHGDARAQTLLRSQGDTEPFPLPSISEYQMWLEPRNQAPGTSPACGSLIS